VETPLGVVWYGRMPLGPSCHLGCNHCDQVVASADSVESSDSERSSSAGLQARASELLRARAVLAFTADVLDSQVAAARHLLAAACARVARAALLHARRQQLSKQASSMLCAASKSCAS
jgi:hypothetical protein